MAVIKKNKSGTVRAGETQRGRRSEVVPSSSEEKKSDKNGAGAVARPGLNL